MLPLPLETDVDSLIYMLFHKIILWVSISLKFYIDKVETVVIIKNLKQVFWCSDGEDNFLTIRITSQSNWFSFTHTRM